MRLWHIGLVKNDLLPVSQLKGQWRECWLILKDIANGKKTNHILINYIWEYPVEDFLNYMFEVQKSFERRGLDSTSYKKSFEDFRIYALSVASNLFSEWYCSRKDVFLHHHNMSYLTQCFYNLDEKHDRGQVDLDNKHFSKIYEYWNYCSKHRNEVISKGWVIENEK